MSPNRTKIEWIRNPDGTPGYVCSPYVGCLGPDGEPCKYCYAARLVKRFQNFHNEEFIPKYNPKAIEDLASFAQRKKPSTVFIGPMTDMFGEWVSLAVMGRIFSIIFGAPRHIFILFTKQPQNIKKHYNLYLDLAHVEGRIKNFFIGVKVTGPADLWRIDELRKNWPGPKFVSLEPYLEFIPSWDLTGIDWVIIGAQTKPDKKPPVCSHLIIEGKGIYYFFKKSMAKHGYKWEGSQQIPWLKEKS